MQETSRTSPLERHQMNYRLITSAADFAAQAHANQRRKGEAAEPYFNHLAQVANLVADAGADAELIAAAYLHDAIEDQSIPADAIAQRFGNDVLQLVLEVTDDKSLPTAQRKAAQLAHAHTLSRRAQMLKIADKISNLSSLLLSPPPTWSISQRKGYAEWAAKVVDACRPGHPQLAIQFDLLHAQLSKELDIEELTTAQAPLEHFAWTLLETNTVLDGWASQPDYSTWASTLQGLSTTLLEAKHDLVNVLTRQEPMADAMSLRRAHQWAEEALIAWHDAERQLMEQGWPSTEATKKLLQLKDRANQYIQQSAQAISALAGE